ncbi:quinone oxidoreductase family protein [Dyadobacter frigoris]|uniref:Zinc-binding alcohol dehydrogenase family protein n=1 Tax=Dyadobacter frigoris TaxID=2576211 RepID=A0A4U6CUU5_9BACT|nr:zinc-binding alcohol dehydrogenase family protein [Dyadobacter frigoris]TKT88046.1 zinc-binding alcohol dehydrogenase family protein [Dyadobacter frigoris]GLU52948.1 putative zinc-binding alcohol dehydrogenase [Dyadobacter frigoris]
MKAAVMNPQDRILQYTEWPEPAATGQDELLMQVKAAAIKNVDRSIASGSHYSSETGHVPKARIIGSDGAGVLVDGTRVYAISMNGMVAEQAVIEKNRMVIIPDNLDFVTAAALPNAVIGAAMGLRFKADLQPGETVLINGATGFTGRIAVQIARHYGAKKIIATGRNPESLRALLELGADKVISLQQSDDSFVEQLQTIHNQTPFDVIMDYLWGHSAELTLSSLKKQGSFTPKTRFVSVGSIAGDILQLSASTLRSVDLHLTGSGLGSLTRQDIGKLFSEILPEMFKLAADGQLSIETVNVPLDQIESVYDMVIPGGKRLVIEMN